MRYYMKFLWIAFFCGIFCILGCTINVFEDSYIPLSEILLIPTYIDIDYYMQYIPNIMFGYIPLLLFQVFYGTYIYRHFCCASVYYFSRCCNRIVWFLKECIQLYCFAFAYLLIFIISGVMVTNLFLKVMVDEGSLYIFAYYMLIYSFFLWFTTMAVNIVGILFTSNVGFVVVEGFVFFGAAVYTISGEYLMSINALVTDYQWMIKWNLFSHLVFGIHNSRIEELNQFINQKGISFDLNESLLVFIILSIVTMIVGCVVVYYHDFINMEQEKGGI